MNDGNLIQNRKVAEQLFDTWREKTEMEQKRRTFWGGSLPAWIGCILSLGAVFWQVAITAEKVSSNTRRVEQVEADVREQSRDNQAVTERLARIEAKLDLVVDKGVGK